MKLVNWFASATVMFFASIVAGATLSYVIWFVVLGSSNNTSAIGMVIVGNYSKAPGMYDLIAAGGFFGAALCIVYLCISFLKNTFE